MPETISSGRSPSRPRSAKRTQSTGVPSVAKPVVPSSNSTSSTQIGERVVMLRAVPLRFVCGAITRTLDAVELAERAAQLVQPAGADSVVVCEQDEHLQ